MKTVEQLIFEKRFKDEEFDPNDYNDWAKENEYEAYQLCLQVAKQLQIHNVSGSLPLIQEAKDLVVRLLPPLEYGEDYDACRLYEILEELEGNDR